MRVYISGPITGHPDYEEKFKARRVQLEQMGYMVCNPADLGKEVRQVTFSMYKREPTYEEYMQKCLEKLLECEGISMLDGWENSHGARVEHAVAVSTGKTIVDVYYKGAGKKWK